MEVMDPGWLFTQLIIERRSEASQTNSKGVVEKNVSCPEYVVNANKSSTCCISNPYTCVLQKATLIPGGSESLVYTTLSGTVGVLVPFTSHEDQDFFQHLEMHMRSEHSPLCGRDHLSFRSYYYPLKVRTIASTSVEIQTWFEVMVNRQFNEQDSFCTRKHFGISNSPNYWGVGRFGATEM